MMFVLMYLIIFFFETKKKKNGLLKSLSSFKEMKDGSSKIWPLSDDLSFSSAFWQAFWKIFCAT